MSRYIIHLLLFSFLLTTSSCMQLQEDIPQEDESTYGFVVSRADDDPSYQPIKKLTYRLLTYNANTFAFDVIKTGTYSGIPGEIMTPTKLNDDGTIDLEASPEEHEAMSLQGVAAVRWVTCISPGLIHNADGSVSFCPSHPQQGMLLSSTERFTVGALKIFQLPPMKDLRSRLYFNISIDPSAKEEIRQIAVFDFIVTGVGAEDEKVGILPKQRQINMPQRPRNIALENVDGSGTEWRTSQPVYVASAIYAPRNVAMSILKLSEANSGNLRQSDYLQATFFLSQNGQNAVKMSVTLNTNIPELLPMYEYAFNFNVKSTTVDLNLEVYSYDNTPAHAWCDNDLPDQEIGDVFPVLSFHVGSWPIGTWTAPNLDDNPEIQ